jgi:hypothetical protein
VGLIRSLLAIGAQGFHHLDEPQFAWFIKSTVDQTAYASFVFFSGYLVAILLAI